VVTNKQRVTLNDAFLRPTQRAASIIVPSGVMPLGYDVSHLCSQTTQPFFRLAKYNNTRGRVNSNNVNRP